ncbi:MAG: type II secretion system F family protein [Flavobacteriales bacterium]|nr:type II secretion system F family protein [Flavobacteriales bacterium]
MELVDVLAFVRSFLFENIEIFIFILTTVFCISAFFLINSVGRDVFGLYKRRFYFQVDKGLRDVVVLIEPSQVFTITIILAVFLGPLIFLITNLVIALSVVGVILFAPPIILNVMKEKRSDKFIKQLPDALSAIASSMSSGLNLIKSLQQVVKNQPEPIAQEFAQVMTENRVGHDLNDSLDDLAERIGRQDVVLMNSAIKISRAVGGNLGETLNILSRTLREKSKVEGKVRALTSMGKAQGNLAMGFPVFMGYVFFKLEPQAMNLLFTSKLGWIWLGIMGAMAVMGAVLIKKVVTIDI